MDKSIPSRLVMPEMGTPSELGALRTRNASKARKDGEALIAPSPKKRIAAPGLGYIRKQAIFASAEQKDAAKPTAKP